MEILKKYFPQISNDQRKKILDLQNLCNEWNEKINLVSRKDIGNLTVKHILPSLAISNAVVFEPNNTVLDIGTGGGFPGLPLAIIFPNVNFTLIDSIGKKINAVVDISERLGLKNVHCKQQRSEELNEKFEYIVGRAVKNWPEFLKIAHKNLKPGGKIIYLSGGDVKIASKKEKIYDLARWFDEDVVKDKKIIIYSD